jgi:hypothetical protein
MKCPHCNQEISGKVCPECGSDTPLESLYCMNCGISLEEEQEEGIEKDNGFDFENRVLCPDGTCTGIIIDGKCVECGKPFKKKK